MTNIPYILNPTRLTGPIFDKELRVASRRRRNYLLRFAYIALLTAFVVGTWISYNAAGFTSPVFRASRMAEAAKTVTATIIWYQFCATQLLAIVMLANAISDEIYKRTLATLMTTPITPTQIVFGKLLSKLLQLVLLLALSLPVLAIVRSFGGITAGYVPAALLITLAALLFIGSLSLVLSTCVRHAHTVVIYATVICAILYGALPSLAQNLTPAGAPRATLNRLALYLNPFAMLYQRTEQMLSPLANAPLASLPLHLALMTAASATLIILATIIVRKVGMRQATGQTLSPTRQKPLFTQKNNSDADHAKGPIRRVKGQPIIWKEFYLGFRTQQSVTNTIVALIFALVIIVLYVTCLAKGLFDDPVTHIVFVLGYFFLALLRTAAVAASCITTEKEARSWPILLTNTLNDSQIVVGKIVGSVARCYPFYLLILAHLLVFTAARLIHPAAILHIILLAAGTGFFFAALGVFFSAHCRRTNAAVAWTLAITIFSILPVCNPCGVISPLIFAAFVLMPAAGAENAHTPLLSLEYDWLTVSLGFFETSAIVLTTIILLALVGLVFVNMAIGRVRTRPL